MIEFSVSCVEIPAPTSLNERVNLNWTKAFIPLDKSKPLYWPALAWIYALDQSIASKHLLTALSKGIRSSVSIISIVHYFYCTILYMSSFILYMYLWNSNDFYSNICPQSWSERLNVVLIGFKEMQDPWPRRSLVTIAFTWRHIVCLTIMYLSR